MSTRCLNSKSTPTAIHCLKSKSTRTGRPVFAEAIRSVDIPAISSYCPAAQFQTSECYSYLPSIPADRI
jgi:hypothetical protein